MGSPVLDSRFDWFWILVAGQKSPQVLVDDTRAAAAEFTALAKSVGDTGPRIEALRAQIAQALPPDVAEQFSKASRMFSDSMPNLNAGAGQLGESLTKLALDVEKTNYSIIIQVSAFAASAVLALLTPFTAWLVPGIIAAARLVVAQLISRLVTAAMTLAQLAVPGITRILQAVEKLRWLGRLLAAVGTEAAQEVAQEGLAQGIQIAQGHRALSNIDGNSLAQAAGWGALAGAQIKGLADLAGQLKPKVSGHVAVSAANQALGETTVGIASALANGMPLDDVWMGTVSGAATTLAHHGAHATGHAAANAMGVNTPNGSAMDSSQLGGFASLEKLGSGTGRNSGNDERTATPLNERGEPLANPPGSPAESARSVTPVAAPISPGGPRSATTDQATAAATGSEDETSSSATVTRVATGDRTDGTSNVASTGSSPTAAPAPPQTSTTGSTVSPVPATTGPDAGTPSATSATVPTPTESILVPATAPTTAHGLDVPAGAPAAVVDGQVNTTAPPAAFAGLSPGEWADAVAATTAHAASLPPVQHDALRLRASEVFSPLRARV